MAKEPKLPLKTVLQAIDKRDKNFYNNLTTEQRKSLGLWMMLRYASSVQGKNAAQYIFMVNELFNQDFYSINKHPELQWLLLSACGSGKVEFHPYIKPPTQKKKKNKSQQFIADLLPHLKADEIEMVLSMNSKQELKDLAKDYGYDDKTIKDIFGK